MELEGDKGSYRFACLSDRELKADSFVDVNAIRRRNYYSLKLIENLF